MTCRPDDFLVLLLKRLDSSTKPHFPLIKIPTIQIIVKRNPKIFGSLGTKNFTFPILRQHVAFVGLRVTSSIPTSTASDNLQLYSPKVFTTPKEHEGHVSVASMHFYYIPTRYSVELLLSRHVVFKSKLWKE